MNSIIASLPHAEPATIIHERTLAGKFATEPLECAAGLKMENPAAHKLDKLEAALATTLPEPAMAVPLFATLLGISFGDRYPPLSLSPARQRQAIFFATLDIIESLALQRPLLLLFEDAHWADATSIELIGSVCERVRALPVLVIISFRPEFESPWPRLPNVTTLVLDRLDQESVGAVLRQVAIGQALLKEVLQQLVAKADGIPLFAEELTTAVLESGLLVEDSEGWHVTGPLPPLAVPATLQASLTARLDRLAPAKEVAQIGAPIGRDFSYALLSSVAGRDEATLNAALGQIEMAGLVFRSGVAPDAAYSFKHALIQDAAYEGLLKSRRPVLHRRIAEALCDRFPDRANAEPEMVAQHFTRASLRGPAVE